ncbi:MAG: lysophospholipid acyltransferase family protein [Anaerolineales bacterium]|nr:lysophospholipid acyltransferase family protein [Anaerolineales bacterium]
MNITIFNTPILSALLRRATKIVLFFVGWRVEGVMPDLPKFVWIGAPHTSNWDFMLLLALGFTIGAKLKFMGKSELFRPPFGFFFYWCGGIPVVRTKSNGLVEQTVKAIQNSKEFILAIAPQGTRDKTREWKSGFYHIAKNAGIPLVLGFVDAKRKIVGVGKTFTLTDNIDADMTAIKSFYAELEGINY